MQIICFIVFAIIVYAAVKYQKQIEEKIVDYFKD